MSTSQTLTLNYSADGLSKLEIPTQAAQPGEPVRVYLWGRSAEDLSGYRLGQGAENLGPGTLRQYPGQTTEVYFDLTGDGAAQDFDWPVLSLASVTAYGNLYAVDGNDVSLVALPGEDVTRYFRLSGNALVRNVEAGAPTITGSVRAVANRSPWCREWRWTAPDLGLAQRTRLTIRNVFSSKDGASVHTIKAIPGSDAPASIRSAWIQVTGEDEIETLGEPGYGFEKLEDGYCIFITDSGADEDYILSGFKAQCPYKIPFEKNGTNRIDIKFKSPTGLLGGYIFENVEFNVNGLGSGVEIFDRDIEKLMSVTLHVYGNEWDQCGASCCIGETEYDSSEKWELTYDNQGNLVSTYPKEMSDGQLHVLSLVVTKNNMSLLFDDVFVAGGSHDGSLFTYDIQEFEINFEANAYKEYNPGYNKSNMGLMSVTVSVS